MLDLQQVTKDWTLFLDRDGVINEEKYMDYVYSYHEFIFMDGVKEALKILAAEFNTIIMVTNQRGVGRGLMTEQALISIQDEMIRDIRMAGGRIDKIYYCTSVDNSHPHRKPNPGMALMAQQDLPGIDFSKSIMIGNNLSDMEFGRNAGMFTVHLRTTHPDISLPHSMIDRSYKNLAEFANDLVAAKH